VSSKVTYFVRFLNNFPQSKFSHFLCHFYMHKTITRWGQQIIVVVVVVVVSYIIVWFTGIDKTSMSGVDPPVWYTNIVLLYLQKFTISK
jgi:hypothetical protein